MTRSSNPVGTRTVQPLPTLDFIPALTPRFGRPAHLAAVATLFDRASRGEEVQAVASTPPRHGKTELEKHAIVRFLLSRPEARVGFASYSADFATKKSREMRELYRRAGGHVSIDAKAKGDWRTGSFEGGLWAGGIEGAWTGEGFDLLVIDDPIKDRARAESGIERERLWEWFGSVALTRLEPRGSLIVIHTRWTTDDLSGRLIRDGWEHVNLPAIDAQGRALWPARYSVEKLRRIEEQIGPYAWSSLYQGQPYSRGGQLFAGDVVFYDEIPSGPMNVRVGVDFAYSTKSRSDYSVAVALGEYLGAYYVLDVLRMQVLAPSFKLAVEGLCERYGGVRAIAYVGGTEKGAVDMMISQGLRIDALPAIVDKFTRAQPVAAAWSAGKLRVPRAAPWLDAFVSEIVGFTGVRDHHDDQVDALAGAFEGVKLATLAEQDARAFSEDIDAFHATQAGSASDPDDWHATAPAKGWSTAGAGSWTR